METKVIETKRILMTFTGGIDSTYLLVDNLNNGHNVDLLYIQAPGLSHLKVEMEVQAITNLLAEIKKKYPERNITLTTMEPSFKSNGSESGFAEDPCHAHSQQPTWLFFLHMHLRQYHDEVHLAFQVGDSINVHLNDVVAMWDSMLRIGKRYFVPLMCPIRYMTKHDLIRYMAPEILKLTWSCQLPRKNGEKIYACGVCQSCIDILGAISHSQISPELRTAYLKGRFQTDPFKHLQKGYKPPVKRKTVYINEDKLLGS